MAQLTAKQSYTAFGVVLGFALVLSLVCMNLCSSSPDRPTEDSPISLTTEQVTLLNGLQSQGLLSIEPQLNKAYIDISLWISMDAKQKEDFSAAVSIYCANQKGTTAYWAEIYDKRSGQKLAKWSRAYGFDVY